MYRCLVFRHEGGAACVIVNNPMRPKQLQNGCMIPHEMAMDRPGKVCLHVYRVFVPPMDNAVPPGPATRWMRQLLLPASGGGVCWTRPVSMGTSEVLDIDTPEVKFLDRSGIDCGEGVVHDSVR